MCFVYIAGPKNWHQPVSHLWELDVCIGCFNGLANNHHNLPTPGDVRSRLAFLHMSVTLKTISVGTCDHQSPSSAGLIGAALGVHLC